MVQRRASTTSQPNLGPARPQNLRRVSSSSSMSNRSFRRDQSPRRPATSSGPVDDDAPPLPSMPPGYTPTLPKAAPSTRRSVSMGPPARPMSPPKRTGARGMSVDREATRSPPRPVSSRGNGLTTVPELERPASRSGSINFSYPMNARPNSPSPPPSPPTRREPVSLAQQLSSGGPPSQAPNRPVKRTRSIAEKRHSSAPAFPAQRPVGTAVAAAQAAIVPSSPGQATASSRPVLIKRPTTVPEDYQGEARAQAGLEVRDRDRPDRYLPVAEQRRNPTITPEPQIIKSPPTPERVDPQVLSPRIALSGSGRSVDETANISRVRQPSSSPGRAARFSTQLSVAGEQLHHPPPRSVSPVKSAMKHSPQGSLSPDRVPVPIARPAPAPSELSDGTSVGSDDGPRVGGFKRRPTKVSFDDEAEVVGVAASPPTSPEDMLPESPPGRSKSKTTWFGAGKKKPTLLENAGSKGSNEFEDVLKPRPALPSFGSIRAKRNGELSGPTQEEPSSDNESTASSTNVMVVPGWSFANDHAIGDILANAQTENGGRLAEKIDHPPLVFPPTKAAAECPGTAPAVRPAWVDGMQGADFTSTARQQDIITPVTANSDSVAPAITVQPSPELEKGRSSLEGYNVPGGFPRNSLEFDPRTIASTTPTKKNKKKSHRRSGSGSTVIFDESGVPIGNTKGTDDESEESVYSDAAEEFDGNGFGSINAIVGGEQTEAMARANAGLVRSQNVPDESQPIGRAVSPSHNIPCPPDSPDTAHELLPFPSPYPPFPINRKPTNAKPKPMPGGTAVNNKSKRPMSVAGVRGVSFSLDVTNGMPRDGSSMRQKAGPERKRPVSMGPSLLNGVQNPSPSAHDAKRHSMRQTMRSSSQGPQVQFSPTRAMSFEGRPTSSSSMKRTTLRGSGSNKNGKASFFSTGKSPSRSTGKKKLSRAPGTMFPSSRFGDSDDEGDDGPLRAFRSRFADSSDEDEPGPNTLRPVRGIPRRHGMQDGESTELEDSSDGEERRRHVAPLPATTAPKQSPKKSAPSSSSGLAAVARSRGVSREELEDFLHQPSRKPGILDRLHLRKPKNNPEPKLHRPTPEPVMEEPPVGHHGRGGSTTTTVTANNSDIQQPERPSSKTQQRGSKIFEWPLRADRKATFADGNNDVVTAAAPEQPQVNGASEAVDDSKAVADKEDLLPAGNDGRPAVERSEGPVAAVVSGEGGHFPKPQRATTARDVVIAGSGRKRRFPKLRRVLGLRT